MYRFTTTFFLHAGVVRFEAHETKKDHIHYRESVALHNAICIMHRGCSLILTVLVISLFSTPQWYLMAHIKVDTQGLIVTQKTVFSVFYD